MKSAQRKLAVTIIPLIVLVLLVTVAVGLAGKTARIQTASITYQQPGPELPGHSYCEVMNNLFAAGGR